jgi:hypothetical protein
MRGLTEIVPIQDIFASGLGAIERLEGNCFRFHLYVSQEIDGDGRRQKVVVAKIVVPASAIPDAILQMIEAIGDRGASIVPLLGEMLH